VSDTIPRLPIELDYQDKMTSVKTNYRLRSFLIALGLLVSLGLAALAQIGPQLQLAELTKKLHLTDQQTKELTPIVEERDKQIKALMADTSMGKLQKMRKASEIQTSFRDHAAAHLNADQVKKLEALQAERRAKLMAH
jgi:hypothetical protein